METQFQEVFGSMMTDIPDIVGIAAVTSDGRILSYRWNALGLEVDKVAALASATLGLGKKTIQVIDGGEFQQVAVVSHQGIIAIYSAGAKTVLLVHLRNPKQLGMLNLIARDAVARIEKITGAPHGL